LVTLDVGLGFFFSSRRRHTRFSRDWSSDVCSSDLLLSQRVSPKVAEQMMLNGVMYSSDELHKMGIVDVLVPKGEGVRAVHEVIQIGRASCRERGRRAVVGGSLGER